MLRSNRHADAMLVVEAYPKPMSCSPSTLRHRSPPFRHAPHAKLRLESHTPAKIEDFSDGPAERPGLPDGRYTNAAHSGIEKQINGPARNYC
jgi:hypothetical protein